MEKRVLEYVAYLLCVKMDKVIPLSGGDISQVYALETETERFVCKVYKGETALKLLRKRKPLLQQPFFIVKHWTKVPSY